MHRPVPGCLLLPTMPIAPFSSHTTGRRLLTENATRNSVCAFTLFSPEPTRAPMGPMGPRAQGPWPMAHGPMAHGPRGPWPMAHGPMGPMGPWPMAHGPMGPIGPWPMAHGPMDPITPKLFFLMFTKQVHFSRGKGACGSARQRSNGVFCPF